MCPSPAHAQRTNAQWCGAPSSSVRPSLSVRIQPALPLKGGDARKALRRRKRPRGSSGSATEAGTEGGERRRRKGKKVGPSFLSSRWNLVRVREIESVSASIHTHTHTHTHSSGSFPLISGCANSIFSRHRSKRWFRRGQYTKLDVR